jgi:hypothetical protein
MAKRPSSSARPESKAEEHHRLQERTEELKVDHAALSRARTPFNQANHDRHNADLRHHKQDLAAHKRRQNDRDRSPED